MQFLYSVDYTKYDWREELEPFWAMNPSKPGVRMYADKLIAGTCEHMEEIDAAIGPALDNWSLDRIGAVERASLRVALFEMRFCADVPDGVVINEALEVVKVFGGDESPRFINGVLERLRRVNEGKKTEVAADDEVGD